MSFKSIIKEDINKVFLNVQGFAEYRTVQYDGNVYTHIPVLLNSPLEKDRNITANDHAQGVYLVSQVMHCNLDDIGGLLPEKGCRITISDLEPESEDNNYYTGRGLYDHHYYIAQSNVEMGKVRLLLEARDE